MEDDADEIVIDTTGYHKGTDTTVCSSSNKSTHDLHFQVSFNSDICVTVV